MRDVDEILVAVAVGPTVVVAAVLTKRAGQECTSGPKMQMSLTFVPEEAALHIVIPPNAELLLYAATSCTS